VAYMDAPIAACRLPHAGQLWPRVIHRAVLLCPRPMAQQEEPAEPEQAEPVAAREASDTLQ
jgi:hypothetical protein